MNTRKDPRELVLGLLNRSVCSVMVASVIYDNWGIHSWAANNSGRDGFGQHAEAFALERMNPRRAAGSTIVVAAKRRRNDRTVTAKPCEACAKRIAKWGLRVIYRDGEGNWNKL